VEILVDMAAHPWRTRAWCPEEIVAAGDLIRLLVPCDKEQTGNEMFMGLGGEFEVPIRTLRDTVSRAHSYMGSSQNGCGLESDAADCNPKSRAEQAFHALMRLCPVTDHAAPSHAF